jgi:hypothetical protein
MKDQRTFAPFGRLVVRPRHLALSLLISAVCTQSVRGASVLSQFFDGKLSTFGGIGADFVYNFSGSANTIDVGDVIISVFNLQTTTNLVETMPARRFGSSDVNEFTGMTALEVLTKTGGGSGARFMFGPVGATKRSTIIADPFMPLTAAALATWSPQTLVAFYEDTTIDFARSGASTRDALVGTAVGGTSTKMWELGLNGIGGELAEAITKSDNLATIAATSIQTNAGWTTLTVNLIPGSMAVPLDFRDTVVVLSSASPGIHRGQMGERATFMGTGGEATPFHFYEEVSFYIVPYVVAEPSTIVTSIISVLMGLCVALQRGMLRPLRLHRRAL